MENKDKVYDELIEQVEKQLGKEKKVAIIYFALSFIYFVFCLFMLVKHWG